MKDILSMGLQKHTRLAFSISADWGVGVGGICILLWSKLQIPDEFLCQLLHKGVDFNPVVFHASRSETFSENNHVLNRLSDGELATSHGITKEKDAYPNP